MLEFITVVCLTFTCYVNEDVTVVQIPIEHPHVHPDEGTKYTEQGITIVSVPLAQDI